MKLCVSLLILLATVSMQAQLKLNFQFTGMTPHVGQSGFIRLIDNANSKEVVRFRHLIPSASYNVVLMGLVAGHSYNVDFYADMNMNGLYDMAPMDHTWRRTIDVVDQDVALVFNHNTQFTEIAYPNEPPVTTNVIESAWSGTWNNITFTTTGPGSASLVLNGTTGTMTGSITMVGAFGSPTPVTISGSGPYDQETDVAVMNIDAPLSGTLTFSRGTVSGTIAYPSFGVQMVIDGNYGDDQIMYTYVMSGAFTANGWMVLNRDNTTDVAEPLPNVTSVFPNPALNTVTITWDAEAGKASQVVGYSMVGDRLELPIQTSQDGRAVVDVSGFVNGVYALRVQTQHAVVSGRFIK